MPNPPGGTFVRSADGRLTGHLMLAFILRRLAGTLVVLLTVSVFVFGFVRLLPGDPARLVAGPEATAEDVAAVRAGRGSATRAGFGSLRPISLRKELWARIA